MVRYKNLLWNVCDGMDNASDGKVERCVFIQRGKKHFMNHPTSTKLHVKKKIKNKTKGSVLRVAVILATTRLSDRGKKKLVILFFHFSYESQFIMRIIFYHFKF